MIKSIFALRPTTKHYRCMRHPLNEFREAFCIHKKKNIRREVIRVSRMRLPGVDDELHKILNTKMDGVDARRRAREAFKDVQLGIDHILFKTPSGGIKMEESYEKNSKGVEIFCKSWLPGASRPKAAVFYCHGYGDTCTFFFEGIARKLALSGYGVFAMDYPGFGLSEGLHAYIHSFDGLVDDVIEHYTKIKENPPFQSLPSFLFGQSMGGAVALKVHLKQPKAWDGAILVAPMCKIADDMVPPKLLTHILIGIANVLPRHKLVPQKDLAEAAFRDLKKKEQAAYNVIAYKDKPRLRTAVEMLKTTQEIEQRLEEVSLPLLILHGEADTVTDPSVSKVLHEKANCSDKKLKLYKDAYHSLLEGEPDEIIIQVFGDIISWLDEHSLKQNHFFY
ncbi:caffeoylshikimate esterase [Abrus precatorius]|uniref:Caffeoylshikimate esterase n=1 Tax=Abrus precatorius TaxID=3816 RepID=A0A8B8LNP9_ABRPR|nr:caffeoylshikimate esterase [Abrus precatorius]